MGLPYFFWFSPALQDEYMSIDIFNTDPAGKTESGVSPNPVHYCSQLSQKWNQAESEGRAQLVISQKQRDHIKWAQ